MRNKKTTIILSILIGVFVAIYLIAYLLKGAPPFLASKSYTLHGITYEATYNRYNKIVKEAADSRDPNICDEIDFGQDHDDYRTSVEESRYFCRADYAVKASDMEYCKTLDSNVKFKGTISQRNKCIRDLAKKLNDKSLCDFLSNKVYCPF